MLKELFDKATEKAGNQEKLGEKIGLPQSRISAFRNYKGTGKKPSDALIGELAEYVGLNPIETILQCKLETDKEKATLWEAWLSKIVVRSAGLEPTPQASEARVIVTFIYNFIQSLLKLHILKHNLNERSALC